MNYIIKFLLIFISTMMSSMIHIVEANDGFHGVWPWLYDGSKQEGRNVCLGIVIADDSDPGIDSTFSVGGWNSDSSWILFEERKFLKSEAVASIRSKENYDLYLFIVPDVCMPDEDANIGYLLYEYGIPDDFPNGGQYITGFGLDFTQTGKTCEEITEDTCSSVDLTEFYSWEKDEDDEEPPGDDDDDDDDNDDSDDGQCGGCASSNGKFSLPLAFGMFLIGLFAWGVARKRSERKF